MSDRDAAASDFRPECRGQVRAAQASVAGQRVVRVAEGRVREFGAGGVEQAESRQGEAALGDGPRRRDRAEGPHPVAGQREEGAEVLAVVGVGLVDLGREAGLVEGQGGGRTGDAGPDDQDAHSFGPLSPGWL
jgi:hypothetical protein